MKILPHLWNDWFGSVSAKLYFLAALIAALRVYNTWHLIWGNLYGDIAWASYVVGYAIAMWSKS